MFRSGLHLHRQVSSGDGFRNRGHLLQVSHHIAEAAGQFSDLILALDINRVVQVTHVTDLPGHGHQISKRFRDGLGAAVCNGNAQPECRKSAQQRDEYGGGGRRLVRFAPHFQNFFAFLVRDVQIFSGTLDPSRCILL